jgi:oxygen-dependent protoporphyrinogen oxidase
MRVHIVGGGFSGLTLAYFLVRQNKTVTIYEKEHWGGCIQTLEHRGALIELAANGILASRRFEELNKEMQAHVRGVEGPQGRFIVSDNRPRRWPLSFLETLPLVGFMLKFLFHRRKISPTPNETIVQWVKRTLSPSLLLKLVEPALRGVYAGDVTRLSASLIFGKFFASKKRPLKARKKGLFTGIKGMEGWLMELKDFLLKRGVEFRFEVVSDPTSIIALGEPVVLATPAAAAAELLRGIKDPRVEVLSKIEMVPVASVTLLLDGPTQLQGFGCLFPECEKFNAYGVLFRQSFFPEANSPHQERWILPWKNESEADLIAKIQTDRLRLWGTRAPLVQAQHVKIWPQALPHYTTQLEAQIEELHGVDSPIILHGNYLGALGLTALLERSFNLAEALVTNGKTLN